MSKKVLFIATVDSHIELFHLPFLKMFKDKGYEVSVATETDKPIKYCDKKIKLPIKRSPFKMISNFKAIRKLKKILANEKYEIVHCHTPVGGVVARMAAKKARKNGTRVIYTAHGFHFYKGAPMHFWMMFYPIEWYLAKFTDTLITINNEDFERAKKRFGKRCRDIQYVPGVGVDPKKFEKKLTKKEKAELRESLGLSSEDKVLIFPAELSKRKNQMWLIKTLEPMFKSDNKLHLLLPGKDSLNGKCQALAKKLGVDKQVHFLGFRNDIPNLLQISDIAVSSARQEGLPVNLMEAAFWGLPIVATDCRGNRDVCLLYRNSFVSPILNSSIFSNNILIAINKSGLDNLELEQVVSEFNNVYWGREK
ncbi:glycosyltransferase family 4 protein [Candidatus Saccharibacteria bacterium]|nr:glycosyltransferase family 4 protein [Candidatus Saccharibacteria bacterium]